MPLTPCREPGCDGFGEDRGRCAKHAKSYRAEAKSKTAGRQLYSTRKWRRVRLRVLARDGWRCRSCGRFGTTVDHVVPIAQGGDGFDESNLQVLCVPCHSRKTAEEVWR